LFCPFAVYEDLQLGGDALFDWVDARKSSMIVDLDQPTQLAARTILAKFANMLEPDGKSASDPWVIALASARGACVVTFENAKGPNAKHPGIPTVCAGSGVRCMDLYDLIAAENWILDLRED